jgi:hypothetical protein
MRQAPETRASRLVHVVSGNKRHSLTALFLLSVMTWTTHTARAAGSEGSENSPGVEALPLIEKFAVPERESSPRDVRWSGSNSLFIGYEMDGVAEYRISEELVHERDAFPKQSGGDRILIWNLALSNSDLHVWSVANRAAWVPLPAALPSEITSKSIRGYFDDVDVRGDVVALLGYPNLEQFEESGRSYLWLGDLRSELAQWRPVSRSIQAAKGGPAKGALAQFYGSARFLHNGDILVFPGFQDRVIRVSQAGKEKASWSLSELETSLLAALGGEHLKSDLPVQSLAESTSTREKSKLYLESQRLIVEDVLPIGKQPAILVRYRSREKATFFLAVLGPELIWFEVGLGNHPASVRLRADHHAGKGRIAVLATDRNQVEESSRVLYLFDEPVGY